VTYSNDSSDVERHQRHLSLGTAAARNLATTTKSAPQMQEITSRWLLKLLPWVETKGGVFRVNRRLSYTVGDGRLILPTDESGGFLKSPDTNLQRRNQSAPRDSFQA
jgi:hypothetical protein